MANSDIIYPQIDWDGLSRRQQISLMDEYYSNNTLYENTRILKHYLSVWNEDLRPLRSPVHRSVEFFVAKVPAGEPVIAANDNQALVDTISTIMEWSNFQVIKPVQVRNLSKYGDLFRKVVTENGKVWHEMVDTADVTDFKTDSRGFLTEIRIDTPFMDGAIQKTRTEFWTINAATPYMAVWEHRMSENTTIEQLAQMSDPIMYEPLSTWGIDFIPFVRSTFADGGGKWGMNCVEHALLKIDEANRQATKLHQTLFRYGKPTWLVSANMTLDDGTPISAPDVTALELRDNSIIGLPGKAQADALVPDIDYAGALAILVSQETELEKDLPELRYYSIAERADMTGKAMRNLLGAAVDRADAARASYVEGTVRLNQMAITIGQFQGIFSGFGTFDSGATKHSIRFGDMFPSDVSEKATILQTLMSALGTENAKLAMQLAGFSDEEISKYVKPEPVLPNATVSTGSDNQQE
jgi:hypothetical protein